MTLLEYVYLRSEEIGDCWEWTGALQACGTTPMMRHQKKTISVRRLIMLEQGLDVQGMVATSKCSNSLCVNPEHLELITRKRLTKRVAMQLNHSVTLVRRAQMSSFVRLHAKLTAELAEEIRQAEGIQREIAKHYGVSQSTVSVIKRGLTWRDYLNPFAQLIK
jgi:predicted XRE-type DNA-binding protein